MGETEGGKCFHNWEKNCLPGPRKSQYDLLSDDSQECCIHGFSAKIMFSVLICVLMCLRSLPLSPILLAHQTEGNTGRRKALWSRFILLSRKSLDKRLTIFVSPHNSRTILCTVSHIHKMETVMPTLCLCLSSARSFHLS